MRTRNPKDCGLTMCRLPIRYNPSAAVLLPGRAVRSKSCESNPDESQII